MSVKHLILHALFGVGLTVDANGEGTILTGVQNIYQLKDLIIDVQHGCRLFALAVW